MELVLQHSRESSLKRFTLQHHYASERYNRCFKSISFHEFMAYSQEATREKRGTQAGEGFK